MLPNPLANEHEIISSEYLFKVSGNQELYTQVWNTGKQTKAAILLIHSLGEHSSRYQEWILQLVHEGFSVLTYDLRGHGKTPGKQAEVTSYSTLMHDLKLMVSHFKKTFKNKALFIYGHSFGGNLAANYAISKISGISGIILSSPWFEILKVPSKHHFIATRILSRFVPGLKTDIKLKPEYLSRELRQIHLYKNDPHIYNKISIRLFIEAYEKGLKAKSSIYKINTPLLVLHGSADKYASCKASREFVLNSGKITTYLEIEGGYHELHNDLENKKVLNLLIEWLKKQISS